MIAVEEEIEEAPEIELIGPEDISAEDREWAEANLPRE